MTASQMRLPGVDPPRQLRPSAERSAPAFWVHRVRVLSELAAGEAYVVRDVILRRGLNIVWAAHDSAGADNALFRDGVAGHTAGKSTFCRLLRHVLGDSGFASDGVKRRIRSKLPNAWVAAEVFVDDARWVVARPLGIGYRSFCLRNCVVDEVADTAMDRQDYQEFLHALARVTTDGLTATKFPTTDKPVGWEHVLPWLVRDQDCRFADFVEWRHSSSGSGAPALNVEERQFLVRTVLGLISEEERAELQRNAQLLVDKREAERLEPLLQHQAETDRRRLSNELGKELPLTSTPLFGSEARVELARWREALEKREALVEENDRREALRTALEDASRHEGALGQSLKDVRERLGREKGLTDELAGNGQAELLALLPSPDFCNVLLSEAREKGCPLAVGRPIDLGAKRSERAAADELAAKRAVVAGLEREVKRLEGEINGAERAAKNARRDYLSANTAYTEAQSKLQDARSKLGQLDKLVEAAEGAAESAGAKAESVKQIARKVEDSYARQEEIREAQRAAIHGFSTRFDYVVRALIGDQVTACVETSGRSLSLSIEERGDRDSAAIATLKLLAFDLAAIVASIEGEGAFPRFLVHDGPREADMASDVYERLFLFAHELEKCFGGDEPGFQYIITTTTTPPDKFVERDAPWLRLRLSGLPAHERFLRQDL